MDTGNVAETPETQMTEQATIQRENMEGIRNNRFKDTINSAENPESDQISLGKILLNTNLVQLLFLEGEILGP